MKNWEKFMINRKELKSWADDAIYHAQNEMRAYGMDGMSDEAIEVLKLYVLDEIIYAYHRGVAEGND